METTDLVVQYLLPFLLIFSIIYGILESLELFKRRIRAVISLVVSIFAVIYTQLTLLPLLENLLPVVSYALIILFGAILIVGMVGLFKAPGAKESWLKEHKGVFAILMLIVFLVLVFASFFQATEVPGEQTSALITILIIFGVFIAIIYFIVREKKEETPKMQLVLMPEEQIK